MARVRSESFSSFLRAPSSSFDGGISEEGVSLEIWLPLVGLAERLFLVGLLHLVIHVYRGSFLAVNLRWAFLISGMAGDITISQFGIYQNGI